MAQIWCFQPDQVYHLSGNKVSVLTLDLNQDFSGIAGDLNAIVREHFGIDAKTDDRPTI